MRTKRKPRENKNIKRKKRRNMNRNISACRIAMKNEIFYTFSLLYLPSIKAVLVAKKIMLSFQGSS